MMCVCTFAISGVARPAIFARDLCFQVLFATHFARGRPGFNSDNLFKTKSCNVSWRFRKPKMTRSPKGFPTYLFFLGKTLLLKRRLFLGKTLVFCKFTVSCALACLIVFDFCVWVSCCSWTVRAFSKIWISVSKKNEWRVRALHFPVCF